MIGMLDWGIGGRSVYQALRAQGSTADVLYFSDAGSPPYGKLSREQLRERFLAIAEWFAQRKVARVLVACHAASSALTPVGDAGLETFGGTAFESIVPAARRAVEGSGARRIGVIGGLRTIHSQVYERALQELGRHFEYHPAQPLSALVEAGELDSAAVVQAVEAVLDQFGPIEALLLACTHYPALSPVLQRVSGGLELLDPGAEMARTVREEGSSGFKFFTTGQRAASARAARLAFGLGLDGEP